MNAVLIYWITTGIITLLLIYRLQRQQEIASEIFKLSTSTTAQVLFLVAAFTLGFIIIPFIIIFTTKKFVKRNWGKKIRWK